MTENEFIRKKGLLIKLAADINYLIDEMTTDGCEVVVKAFPVRINAHHISVLATMHQSSRNTLKLGPGGLGGNEAGC